MRSGLRDLPSINAFAAAGLASDHEVQTPEETWDKLTRGLFVELRVYAMAEIVAWLLGKGAAGLVADRVHDRRSQRQPHARNRRERPQCAASPSRRALRLRSRSSASPSTRRGTCVSPRMSAACRLAASATSCCCRMSASSTIAEVWADGAQVSDGHALHRPGSGDRMAGMGDQNGQHQSQDPAAGLCDCRRARARHHEGRGDPAIPLASRFLHPRAAGARRRRAAGRERGHHQIRHRRSLLRRGPRLEDVLARLRAAHAGDRGRLLGCARQAQHLGRRLVGRRDGQGRQYAGRDAGRLGAGARGRSSPPPSASRSAA